jgi:hypothetical protein
LNELKIKYDWSVTTKPKLEKLDMTTLEVRGHLADRNIGIDRLERESG